MRFQATIECAGKYFRIFDFIHPEEMAQRYMSGRRNANDAAYKESIKQAAKKAIDEYYRRYEERFPYIGDPMEIRKRLDKIRAEAAEEEEDGSSVSGTCE